MALKTIKFRANGAGATSTADGANGVLLATDTDGGEYPIALSGITAGWSPDNNAAITGTAAHGASAPFQQSSVLVSAGGTARRLRIDRPAGTFVIRLQAFMPDGAYASTALRVLDSNGSSVLFAQTVTTRTTDGLGATRQINTDGSMVTVGTADPGVSITTTGAFFFVELTGAGSFFTRLTVVEFDDGVATPGETDLQLRFTCGAFSVDTAIMPEAGGGGGGGGGGTTLAAVDWSTATGSSLTALMDTGNPDGFDQVIECSGAISDVMSVVNAAAAGLTGWPTTNALQLTALTDSFCGNVEWSSNSPAQFPANPNGSGLNQSPIAASQSHYGCLYFRVEANFFNNHGIAYNAGGTIQMVPIAFNARADSGLTGGGTLGANVQISFKPSFRPAAGGGVESLGYPYNSWLPGIEGGLGDRFLSLNTIYRYEWHVEYVGALSYRFYPRVYTQFGTVPLFDASTFYPVNANPAVESLLDYYAAGNLFSMTDAEIARELSFGHEGPFSLNGGGARCWIGRVRLATGWVGGL